MAATPVGVFVDGSGTLAAGATAEDALPANGGRQYLFIQNIEASGGDDLLVDFGTDAAPGTAFVIAPGAALEFGWHTGTVPTGRVSVYGATLGNAFVLKEA